MSPSSSGKWRRCRDRKTQSRLCCADMPLPGWNVDLHGGDGVDQVVDLNRAWPWADESVDMIVMSHSLEHLDDPVRAMCEAYRVLRKGGQLHVYVPHARGLNACSPGHKTMFTLSWFACMADGCYRQQFITPYWDVLCSWLWLFRRERGIGHALAMPFWAINLLGLKAQQAWEWCGIFPPDEIEWKARKPYAN